MAESTPQTVTLLDSKNLRTTHWRDELEAWKESPVSLMPDNVLDGLSEQQIRDLFAYVQVDESKP